MSAIKAKLQDDVKLAMKARNQPLINTVRGVISEIKRIEIDTRSELNEEQVIGVLQKEIKKRRDALEFAEKASRADLIEQNNSEIAVLQQYLGAQLSDDELRSLIQELKTGGADNMGKLMGALNKDHKGKFDGKRASELVKEILAQ